jgi:hypothetical protein
MATKKEILEIRYAQFEEEKKKSKPGDLITLDLSGINISYLPTMPDGTTRLNFSNNKIKTMKLIPYFLTYINLSSNVLESLPPLPNKLETLILSKNGLLELPELPKSLTYLNISENRLKILPKLPPKLEFLDVNSNNLKTLPELPDSLNYVNASSNNITNIGKLSKNLNTLLLKSNKLKDVPVIPESLKVLDISYNKFEKLPNIPDYTKMNITHNPVEINIRQLKPTSVKTHIYEGKEYQTVKIPKGTVMFHSSPALAQQIECFVGYNVKELYRLHPQHLTFFFLSPSFQQSDYGSVEALYILTEDVEVVLGVLPSHDTKRQIELNYQEDCTNLNYDTTLIARYECFKHNFPNKNGFFTQGYKNFKINPELEKLNHFFSFYTDFEGNINVPELVIHPKKERGEKDIFLPKSDFSYTWLDSHIDEYKFKPFLIFDKEQGIQSYLSKFRQLLSSKGIGDEKETFHMTVHKTQGFYMIAEYTDKKVLKDCLNVDDDSKEDFLKKIKTE